MQSVEKLLTLACWIYLVIEQLVKVPSCLPIRGTIFLQILLDIVHLTIYVDLLDILDAILNTLVDHK